MAGFSKYTPGWAILAIFMFGLYYTVDSYECTCDSVEVATSGDEQADVEDAIVSCKAVIGCTFTADDVMACMNSFKLGAGGRTSNEVDLTKMCGALGTTCTYAEVQGRCADDSCPPEYVYGVQCDGPEALVSAAQAAGVIEYDSDTYEGVRMTPEISLQMSLEQGLTSLLNNINGGSSSGGGSPRTGIAPRTGVAPRTGAATGGSRVSETAATRG